VHLAATGLPAREDDLVPEALEDFDRPTGRFGIQRVGDAGDEERDTH
jgi:hypothetical protein